MPRPCCRGCGLPRPLATDLAGSFAGRCARCVMEPPEIAAVIPAVVYDAAARRLLLKAKEGGWPELFRPLATQVVVALAAARPRPVALAIVPVPSHPLRSFRRGFAPADELARHLARETGLPVRHPIRHRWARARPQKARGLRERLAVAGERFHGSGPAPQGPVLLVDDVMTSGATVHACARLLASMGSCEVSVAVWARALLGGMG